MNNENLKPIKPGEVRNPKGRPKGAKSRKTIAKKWLEAMTAQENPITGEFQNLTQEDLITLAQIVKARQGDTNAYKALIENVYGKLKEELEISAGPGTKQLNIVSASDYLKNKKDDDIEDAQVIEDDDDLLK